MGFAQTLEKIKNSQKKPDGIFGSFMTRPVSHIVAYFCCLLRLSPNQVSVISLLFCISSTVVLILSRTNYYYIIAAILWWIGAIFDAADGDLARFQKRGTDFGKWFDSVLDRIKEFIIFSTIGYLAWIDSQNTLFLLLAALSVFSNVFSGYITDTRKLFDKGKRTPVIKIEKKFIIGMVDTRDFVIILSLFLFNVYYPLYIYGTLFFAAVFFQLIITYVRYHKK